MSIPLDRLYHFIENIAEEIHGDRVIIYRFWPHGSKNLNDFHPLHPPKNLKNFTLNIKIFCADQEPLAYDYYEEFTCSTTDNFNKMLLESGIKPKFGTNLAYTCFPTYNYPILLHSEKRSIEVEKYQQAEYLPVYYWSHALIAQDWFRYAKHEKQTKSIVKKFLIYNRAWSGTREYRLKFADLLVTNNLVNHCQTTLNVIEPELNIHYSAYQFDNSVWKPSQPIDQYFCPTNAHSNSSADYNIDDYNSCDLEIVLETLFDDNRLHLTEKSLRPIALGQPFILMASHGSLEYLRDYGFRTFSPIIDESYDQIKNPVDRMQAIIKSMSQIANWTDQERIEKMFQLQDIANYNQTYFFSNDFFNCVINELKNNLKFVLEQPLLSIKNVECFINTFEHTLNNNNLKKDSKEFFKTDFLEMDNVLKEIKNQYQKLLDSK